jgi:hypothetical protein
MAWSFDVASNIPRLNQSGTDTGLSGIATAITAVANVARSTAYTTAILRKPPTPNGFWYRCSTAGTTAATAPTYGTTLGGTTTDGTSVWTAFKAPDIQTLGTTNHYYMPDIRMAINGTLTNTNPQQENFTCLDLIIFTGNFTSGAWASNGVTPRWDGLHFTAVRSSTSGADGNSMYLQSGGQFTFIGGEVQTAGGVTFENGTTPRCYYTRWRNTKEYGATSARFRSSTTLAIFQDVETFDFAFDLFRMPTVPPSIKARGSEYVYQYVGLGGGGADAKFAASSLENVDGTYDFDNYYGGWVELYNCAKGANLNVVSQYPSSSIWVKHCVPLYQDLRITAKDTAGNLIENVRFNASDSPTISPTVTFTTASGIKTWDFRNQINYETTTNSSGIALTSPVLQVWYWENSFKKNLRFPNSTATYQGRAYNYKTMNVSVVLGSNNVQDLSAGMVGLDTPTTVTETVASAITGISFIPEGTSGGTVVISSNKNYQDVWNYYRWWISQFANKTIQDTWTCIGGTLNVQNWNFVINAGVTLSGSTNIIKLQSLNNIKIVDFATMPYLFNSAGVLQADGVLLPSTVLGVQDSYTGAGAITGIYQNINGTSTTLQITVPSAGYSLCVYKTDGTTKYFANNLAAGNYFYYFMPSEAGTYLFAAENYGQKRTEETFVLNGGNVAYSIVNQEDVGITDTKTVASAYTTLSTTSQLYDATAVFRLSEAGIKLGQIVARDGSYLDFGNYNVKIKDDASAIVAVTTGTITYKSIVINESLKYNAMKATPPATITPTDNEIISVLIEDANGDSRLNILGGDNIGYQLWKVPTTTATDDYATGVLLATLATNALPYRFIGISGFDIVGRDVSSGVRRRTSMLKGVYNQAFYVGNQIQLSTDAPQLIENNEKLSEVILKLDTKLDVAVSTRLEGSAYTNAPTTSQIWNAPTRTLTSAGASGATLAEIEGSLILAKEATSQSVKTKVDSLTNADFTTTNSKIDAVKAKVDTLYNYNDAALVAKVDSKPSLYDMEGSTVLAKEGTSQNIKNKVDSLSNYDDAALVAKVDAKPSLSQIEGSTILAKESTSQSVKTKVDSLNNYNDATTQSKLDAIKAKTDILVNTDLTGIATSVNVTTAKNEMIAEVNGVAVDVWSQEPERLKNVATVETTGDQLASFNNL